MQIIQSPGKYVQRPDVLDDLNSYIKPLARNWLILVDKVMQDEVLRITANCPEDMHFKTVVFKGECSWLEIQRVSIEVEANRCTGIIGFGGGKVLDTAKAVAHDQQIPSVMLPSIASTDAPTSALSVIYSESGAFEEYLFHPSNPNIVIVDTNIIARAPVRLFVSGMGDALATWFEAQACYDSRSTNMLGGQTTRAALALARLCYDILLEEGLKARISVENKVSSRALDRVIEANTYLSGVGFESSGLAAAHAIHNGLTHIEDCHHLFHGEKVAFGTLTQLVLQNCSVELMNEVLDFCISVGLPVTLEQLNVTRGIHEKMRIVAEKSCMPGETIFNMPFTVDPQSVYSALLIADELGQRRFRHGRACVDPSVK